ncbi:MAG: phasin family protein [Cyanobacteria bacterium P01_A01_bin.114]
MADFGNLVQKAFYLGVGLASYASEKAGDTLSDLRGQAQKLVDELVERGEITADEAQKMMNDMMERAQEAPAPSGTHPAEAPRRIEILDDEDTTPTAEQRQAEALRQQVDALREELNNLKRDG